MIPEQEVEGFDARNLKALDLSSVVLIFQQEFDLVGRQGRAQPVPFLIIANVEVNICIRRLVTRSASNYPPKWAASSWSK